MAKKKSKRKPKILEIVCTLTKAEEAATRWSKKLHARVIYREISESYFYIFRAQKTPSGKLQSSRTL